MRETVRFSIEEAVPGRPEVLRNQGLPDLAGLPPAIATLLEAAVDLFERLAEPRGVVAQLTQGEFETVYRGEGRNSHPTPLEGIYPKAEGLALFAATIGEPLGAEISRLFGGNDPALGYMLDAVASAGADRLADLMGAIYLRRLTGEGSGRETRSVLPYSPGYCGWHISAQRRLFEFLGPESIGIRLTDSFLMQPLKSVSGVLVAGRAEIHRFRPSFSFCEDCATHECGERMASVLGHRKG